jgi:hypothetical protein
MLTPRRIRVLLTIGLVTAIAFGYRLVQNLLTSVPRSEVASCRVTLSHTYFVYVTIETGRTLLLSQEDVPDPAHCLAPGTTIEKVRGEFGYRLNGKQFFWESKWNRYSVMLTFAGLLATAGALVTVLRERRAAGRA